MTPTSAPVPFQKPAESPFGRAAHASAPLYARTSETFERFVRKALTQPPLQRLIDGFLQCPTSAAHGVTVGTLRTALCWRALPDFLAAGGWEVLGSTAWNIGPEGRGSTPSFQMVRQSPTEWIEVPENLFVFLERYGDGGERGAPVATEAPERAILHVVCDPRGPMSATLELFAATARPEFFEAWFEHTRRDNPLRGRVLKANGRFLLTDGPEPDWDRVFLDETVRSRLDFALRRFAGGDRRKLAELGVRARGGVILAGPPGNGKTSIGRVLAATSPCTFLWATPGDLSDEDAVREVYELARWLSPCIVFLEDLDVIAEARGRFGASGSLRQLLTELDGAPGDHPILTIATTNRLSVVEEALRNRPGRFDQVLEVGPPDARVRHRFLTARLRDCTLAEGDLDWLVRRLDGASGAEIEEACNGALFLAHELAGKQGGATDAPLTITRGQLTEALEVLRRDPDAPVAGFGKEEN